MKTVLRTSLVALVALVGLMHGCLAPGAFPCRSDAECVKGGTQGKCIRSSCAFADASCAAGIRWDPTAQSQAGECLCIPDPCPSPDHAIAGCVKSTCRIASCVAGYLDCDERYDNGCEANGTNSDMQLDSAINHCGACGARCPLPAHAISTSCQASVCKVTLCASFFADCDGQYENGCEASLADSDGQIDSEIDHCGACGTRCLPPERVSSTSCQASTCKIAQCSGFSTDCDGKYANGCEGTKYGGSSCSSNSECENCICRLYFNGSYYCD